MKTLVSVIRKVWLWDWLRGRHGRGRQVTAIAIYGFGALALVAAATPTTKKQSPPVAAVQAAGSRPSGQHQRRSADHEGGRHVQRVRSDRTRRAAPKTSRTAEHKAHARPISPTRPTATTRPTTTARPTTTTTQRSSGSSSGGAGCTPGYSPCIPPGPDVDCAGGSGNGPRYVQGPVRVTGSDPYGLDANGDGVGCES